MSKYLNDTGIDKFVQFCFVKDAEFDFVVAFPSQKYYINYVVCIVINVFLTLSTTFLNGTTVFAYWKSSQLKKKTQYFVVMLLSLNDLGVGMLCNSSYTVLLLREILGYESCNLTVVSTMCSLTLSGMSFMTLFLLNIERYFGIVHPIFHQSQITKRRLFAAAMCMWCLCVIESGVVFISQEVGDLAISSVITMLLVILGWIYFKIFRTMRRIASVTAPCRGNVKVASRISRVVCPKRILQKKKQAKGCLMVLVCTFCCFLPLAVTSAVEKSPFSVIGFAVWSMTLVYMSSSLNSVIFFWRNQILRAEAQKVFRQVFLESQWSQYGRKTTAVAIGVTIGASVYQ